MFNACICCYNSCNCGDPLMGCRADGEIICFEGKMEFKMKKPTVCVAMDGDCCCIHQAASFPFNDKYVGKPVCSVCALQCTPNPGCMKPPPVDSDAPPKNGGAPAGTEMER